MYSGRLVDRLHSDGFEALVDQLIDLSQIDELKSISLFMKGVAHLVLHYNIENTNIIKGIKRFYITDGLKLIDKALSHPNEPFVATNKFFCKRHNWRG